MLSRVLSSHAIERFEDLIAWQKARQLAHAVYLATQQGNFARDRALAVQLQRAAVSVMANIAEGFERHRLREFHQFLSTARSSCAEVRSHLYVASDVGYTSDEQFDRLNEQAREVGRIVGGLRASLRIDALESAARRRPE